MDDLDALPPDKRRNHLLRVLVDDLLQQVREAQRQVGPWSPVERAEAEASLLRIMAQVREEAFRRAGD